MSIQFSSNGDKYISKQEKIREKGEKKNDTLTSKLIHEIPTVSYKDFCVTQNHLQEIKSKFTIHTKSKLVKEGGSAVKLKDSFLKKGKLGPAFEFGSVVGKGSRVHSKSLILGPTDLAEARSFSFKFGDQIIKGRFYKCCPFLEHAFKEWKKNNICDKKSLQDFINEDVISNLNEREVKETISSLLSNKVQYFPKKLRKIFEITCDSNKLQYKYPILISLYADKNRPIDSYITYLTEQAKLGLEEKPTTLPDGRYGIVLDQTAHLLLFKKTRGHIQHSSPIAGEAVLAAGQIEIKNGEITFLSNSSGHYLPSSMHFLFLAEALKEKGFDLSKVTGEVRTNTKRLQYVDDINKLIDYERSFIVDALKNQTVEKKISAKGISKIPYYRLIQIVDNLLASKII